MVLEEIVVVTAKEMARIEKEAISEGADEESYMLAAGKSIAAITAKFIETRRLPKQVLVLAGKGNNGGDAFAAGVELLERGFSVDCIALEQVQECSPLCQKQYRRFLKLGKVQLAKESAHFPKASAILDGLVGTGFTGKAEGMLAKMIERANLSKLPILAIDIPSGLNGSTGEVASVAIRASQTIYLELLKLGFFIGSGWEYVGELIKAPFGLDPVALKRANVSAYLLSEEILPLLLPPPKRTRHKYDAGYVIAVAGSDGMAGAALLASFAALKSGSGIVRLFYPENIKNQLGGFAVEVIKQGWDLKDLKSILQEAKRAKALLIGPGCGRTAVAMKAMKKVLETITLPTVIDADALFFLSENKRAKIPKHCVLTPHKKEAERLIMTEVSLKSCQKYVERKKQTLLLKGAPSFIFHPGKKPLIMCRGDPAMATAGTGDVLTGIIASMLAKGLMTREAAAVGALLHGLCGEKAAKAKSSYGVVASDLIDALAKVFIDIRPLA